MFNEAEKQQYSRHLILDEIGEAGQLKLKQAKVLVIGAGGLGCPILQYLTAAGVGTIGIVDNDVVDASNLQRQVLYTHEDVGTPKVLAAKTRLSALNPNIRINTYHTFLTRDNAVELFEQYDIIVDGSDNFPTRYLTNDASILAKKPLVFGSIFKFDGQVAVFNFNDGPSYRCLYPTPPKPNSIPNCSDIGVLGVLPGIIGTLQANETLKIILGLGDVLSGKLLQFDALHLRQFILKFKKTEASTIEKLEDNYEFFCGISEYNEITLEELEASKDQYNLLDVRTEAEHEDENIGGINIPIGELLFSLEDVPTDKPLVVYCQEGIRSKGAIDLLKEKKRFDGIELINLKGGI